jgi:hypothetical protein
VEATCVFRVAGKVPELWDPLTGATDTLPAFRSEDGRTTVPLRFEPAQSWFVVFRKPATEDRSHGTERFSKPAVVQELTGAWTVTFDPQWGGPAQPVVFEKLEDWTKRTEDGIRFYSGTATYGKVFPCPPSVLSQRLYLDLGTVKHLARVRLNGHDCGVVWCAPWRVEISEAIRERDNQLEISVVNLWPNRLIGDQSLPADKRLTWTTWNPFQKDAPLLESGLLGPVRLLRTTRED